MTPGALYVGVATLTGSVLARNRTFLLRVALPPTLFILSMNHFLPKTSYNISSYLSLLERAHAPALADARAQFNGRVASTTSAACRAWYHVQTNTITKLEHTVSRIQDTTGLKLREAVGWDQKVAKKSEMSSKRIDINGGKDQRDT